MTQKYIDTVFDTSLGQQLLSIYVTSDDRMFIRLKEALLHSQGSLDNTKPLKDKIITEWFPSTM